MNVEELYSELKKRNISEDRYSLQGIYGSSNDENKIALTIKMGKYTAEYEVYYKERGEKQSERTFTVENDACEYILNIILEQTTIEKVQSITRIDGMTVNERLYASGLMECLIKPKKRIKLVLLKY